MFTTRPEILGTFGVVTSTHWIASAVGMNVLEKGGNAFDACAATAFTLQIVEPHLCGPAGEAPAVFYSKRTGKVEVLCSQGVTPAAATIEEYKRRGLDMIPGSGLLATVVPGAFDGWMLLLREHGSLPLRDILGPAIGYARDGHPMLPRVSEAIAAQAEFFAKEWPTSAATWTPNGAVPTPRALFRNPMLAITYQRILDEAESAGRGDRVQEIEAARNAFMKGFVAEAIDRFCRTTEVMDASGQRNGAVLTGQDLAEWQASFDEPQRYDYHGWTVCKQRPWGQGPAFLQALSLLKGFDIAAMDPKGADYIHTVAEAMKLAYADREAYYGDPNFSEVPIDQLLSDAHADERRKLIGDKASKELRPSVLPGFEEQVKHTLENLARRRDGGTGVGAGEPTMAHLRTAKRGDTVHIDVIDRWGNMISATPSGGWLQSSPVIPELGFPLNSRAQMFWLEPGLPTSLAPKKRPRTTLTPSLALHEGRPTLVFGTPGGDQQDQWQLSLFLRRVHHGLNLQEAIDLPLFHTGHFPSSFYPRESRPGHLMVEANVGEDVIADLKRRGHDVEVAEPWTVGRLTAAEKDENGILHAAATPRLMQAYAIGR
ncbi:gamma-glutamyltransferase [Alsobacter soli]|uniref:Gamma-glutamyltransferase n=1 Tax=Alsobacter soli TaxID=2109933 RepID=A0A2T1HV06_9HYPH|nr:gamma-glutamyltransferase family protein [Alsobacter soli]PSC05496.1 gamma-glutamyltransferase [Alsobacter soli]